MKKVLQRLALSILLYFAFGISVYSQQLTESETTSVHAELKKKDATLLWEDNWNPSTSSQTIVSTYFGQLDPPLTLAADDFHIADEDGWDITSFWTRGLYLGANDGDGFGFRIYSDDNGQPGDLLHDILYEEDFDISDVIEINLEEPLHLEQGSYWLGIYGYFPLSGASADGRFGQLLWNPNPPANENAMIRDYSDLFGLADDGWVELVNIGISFTGLDFAIFGIGDDEPEFAEVTFNLTDDLGEPVGDAVISLGDMINDPGDYVFVDVPVGTYEYTISKFCYITQEGEIQIQNDMTYEVELSYNLKPGDLNLDGIVDMQDVYLLGNYFLDGDSSELCLLNADVKGDGEVNIFDALAIIRVTSDSGLTEPGAVTDADGNVYSTYVIGEQEWMAENLIVTSYNNGDAILSGLDDSEWSTTTQGAYAIYDHNGPNADGINSPEEMVAAYGNLYNWYAVTDSRGLCPQGWHVPSNDEWTQLIDYLISQGFPNESSFSGAGRALKSCRQVNSPLGGSCDTYDHPRWNSTNNVFGFNEYGFSALPGGFRYKDGSYNSLGSLGLTWTSTNYSSDQALMRFMYSTSSAYPFSPDWKRSGFSVRCVREVE